MLGNWSRAASELCGVNAAHTASYSPVQGQGRYLCSGRVGRVHSAGIWVVGKGRGRR